MKKINILVLITLCMISISSYSQQAKSLIIVYLEGGPSQTDTFDPKPNATRDIHGPLSGVQPTNVPGIVIGEKLPMLAKIADKYSLISTMTHGIFAHETAHYGMITGDLTGGSVVYPSFGSTISYCLRQNYKGVLPSYISVTGANTRFNESGFLGNSYKSFDTKGIPEKKIFEVDGLYNSYVSPAKFEQRMQLLQSFEQGDDPSYEQGIDLKQVEDLREQNNQMITGKLKEVFNLSKEGTEVRQQYGMNRIGQSCLAARRLVEAGVQVVNVRITGWDTHKSHFPKMNELLPQLDKALATLISDLDKKGLLSSTIVLCGGEFGRTPRIQWEAPWNGGRAHFGTAFSYLVAGGGFAGGKVLGTTDETGEKILDRPVYPCDLIGTVYQLMGISPTTTLPHPVEGNLPILPSLGKQGQSNGLVTELLQK